MRYRLMTMNKIVGKYRLKLTSVIISTKIDVYSLFRYNIKLTKL